MCVFCKILQGEIPCFKVYEDADTLAFLDIGPFEKGHTLVIPRRHGELLTDLTEEEAATLGVVTRRIGGLLMERLPCDGFNVMQNNGACASQVVPHVHFHVVPRWSGRDINWQSIKYDSTEEMAALAERLRG
ncbi:MAG: HIT domain-containing protein [Lentisphaerae bacterium]|jgi:histidine triad (HIT) family protein|nr:HIT domain-containing protein [Lentisphaerota bacterium]